MLAAGGVGFGHAVLPDHWAPLAVVGRTQSYTLARVARLSGAAALAHVFVSIVLGAVLIAIGLGLRSTVEHVQNAVVGSVLLATGLGFAALELLGRGHRHRHEHDDHHHDHPHPRRAWSVLVPFGAAASPDLTILPVFLAASAAGAGTAIASLVVFAAVTVATIVGLTLLATAGGYRVKGVWLERWGGALTAVVLVVLGVLVLTGTI